MGDLVAMSRTQPLTARAYSASHSAEILFFTGVRYYRMSGDEAAWIAAAATPPVRKRRPAAKQRAAERRAMLEARRHEALA